MTWVAVVALLVALASAAFAWVRTAELQEEKADRVTPPKPPRYDTLQGRVEETLRALTHLEENQARDQERWDTLLEKIDAVQAEASGLGGLEQKVEWLEARVRGLERNALLRIIALLASYDATFWEASEEEDDSEGGAVLYYVPGTLFFADVLTEFQVRYHDVGSHPSLRVIGVCTEPHASIGDRRPTGAAPHHPDTKHPVS